MKRVKITLQIFIFFSTLIYGQIEYEGSINSLAKTIQLNDGKVHYYTVDSKNHMLNIFNLDKSLWKSIQLEVPKAESIDEIKLISKKVFDDDELIEVAYTTVWYNLSSEPYEDADGEIAPPHYRLFIINEAGKKLLEVKDGCEIKIVEDLGRKKLLVWKNIKWSDYSSNNDIDIFAITNLRVDSL